jgi:hypothetical protein
LDTEPKSNNPAENNQSPEASAQSNGGGASAANFLASSQRNQEIDAIADRLIAAQTAGIVGNEPRKRGKLATYKHPMVVDLAIAIGLLFAMGALTVSFVRSYTAHSAKTSIMQGNYKAAIQILRGAPVPDIFGGAAMENSDDLLNQALYLDAMEKLDNDHNDQTAPQELAKITPGSRFYDLAQEQLERLNQLRRETEKQEPSPESDAETGTAAGTVSAVETETQTQTGTGNGTGTGAGVGASAGANAAAEAESKKESK